MPSGASSEITALIDDPIWVLAKYEEAKDLIEDIREDLSAGLGLGADIRERVETFWLETFMDSCTTMGIDCGCNKERQT